MDGKLVITGSRREDILLEKSGSGSFEIGLNPQHHKQDFAAIPWQVASKPTPRQLAWWKVEVRNRVGMGD